MLLVATNENPRPISIKKSRILVIIEDSNSYSKYESSGRNPGNSAFTGLLIISSGFYNAAVLSIISRIRVLFLVLLRVYSNIELRYFCLAFLNSILPLPLRSNIRCGHFHHLHAEGFENVNS